MNHQETPILALPEAHQGLTNRGSGLALLAPVQVESLVDRDLPPAESIELPPGDARRQALDPVAYPVDLEGSGRIRTWTPTASERSAADPAWYLGFPDGLHTPHRPIELGAVFPI